MQQKNLIKLHILIVLKSSSEMESFHVHKKQPKVQDVSTNVSVSVSIPIKWDMSPTKI